MLLIQYSTHTDGSEPDNGMTTRIYKSPYPSAQLPLSSSLDMIHLITPVLQEKKSTQLTAQVQQLLLHRQQEHLEPATSVTLTSADASDSIFYTTDGSDPDTD